MFHVEHSLRVGIIKGCPVILLVKSEFGEQLVLFGAGDFSPPNAYIFGTKVPCSDRYAPRQLPIYRGLSNDANPNIPYFFSLFFTR